MAFVGVVLCVGLLRLCASILSLGDDGVLRGMDGDGRSAAAPYLTALVLVRAPGGCSPPLILSASCPERVIS